MTIYYYTCPIKALYMMKDFRVKILDPRKNNSFTCHWLIVYIKKPSLIDKITIKNYKKFGHIIFQSGLEAFPKYFGKRGIIRTTELFTKIYVAPESYHIFEPKKKVKTLKREKKQFFMPEVENERH